MTSESCCRADGTPRPAPTHCPECRRPGRAIERITLKALLRPEALMSLSASEHRFCSTSGCAVVYFGDRELFFRQQLVAPVFQKERPGARTACYCFAITEEDIRREVVETGRSTASERVTALVKADRCACEVRNPQGSCCLGNLKAIEKALQGERRRGARGRRASKLS